MGSRTDFRQIVEQAIIPDILYTDGPMLLMRILGNPLPEIKRFYSLAGTDDFCLKGYQEHHIVFYQGMMSLLVICIQMPRPIQAPHCRAVYLCYCSHNGENLYFTSELNRAGTFSLVARQEEHLPQVVSETSAISIDEEMKLVAKSYWELIYDGKTELLESVRAG